MSMTIIDNFSLKGKKFMDGRQDVATLAALKAIPDTDIPEGFQAYCRATKKWYKFDPTNTVDANTGKWREVAAGEAAAAIANAKAEAISTAASNADSKIKAAVTDKLGQPGGIATLAENGLVDTRFIPGSYDDVIELTGIVSGVTAQAVDNSMAEGSAKCTKLYYDSTNHRILGSFTDGTYHYWKAGEEDDNSAVAAQYRRYMLPGGTPMKGKIYVDMATNRQYRWGGSSMVELGKQMALGTPTGAGNAITSITVADNMITPVKGEKFATEGDLQGLRAYFVNNLDEKADAYKLASLEKSLEATDKILEREAWKCIPAQLFFDGSYAAFRLCRINLAGLGSYDGIEYLGLQLISVEEESVVIPIMIDVALSYDSSGRIFCHVDIDKPNKSDTQNEGIAVQLNSDGTVDVSLYMYDGTGMGGYGGLFIRTVSSKSYSSVQYRITPILEAGGCGDSFEDGIADGSIIQGETVSDVGEYRISVSTDTDTGLPDGLMKRFTAPVYVEDSNLGAIPVSEINALFA